MRNRYFDLLRFLAIVRVVVYHVTGWATLTLVFPAMSVMFALAGSLMAASLDKSGISAIGRRMRRLLPSLWLVAAIFVPSMLVIGGLPVSWRLAYWLLPLGDPPTNSWGALALSVIWYLRDYLWFVLVSPLALWLFRRFPLATLLAPYALLVVVELGFPTAPVVLRDFGLYFGAWLLGFAHHDGLLRRLSRRMLLPIVGALGAFGAGWALTHQGARSYDLNDIRFGNAAWSAAFVLLIFGLAPASAGWVNRHALIDRLVTVFNRRALTIYLWHMPFVIVLPQFIARLGWSHHDPRAITVRLAVVFLLVGLAMLAFGWVEDLAARRRPALLPGSEPRVPAVPRMPAVPRVPAVPRGVPAVPRVPRGPVVPTGAGIPGPRRKPAAGAVPAESATDQVSAGGR